MNKEQLFELNETVDQIETRLLQLESLKSKTSSQKLELNMLRNHLEVKRKELANAMFRHDNTNDLLELCGLGNKNEQAK